jgi:hypothetical protein
MVSSIACQKTGGMIWALYLGVLQGRVKRRFFILSVFAGNMLLASYGLSGSAVVHNSLLFFYVLQILFESYADDDECLDWGGGDSQSSTELYL